MKPQKLSLWLQLYFVLASLLGLVLIVIGLSSLVNTLLTSTVLKVPSPRFNMPPQPYVETQRIKETEGLTEEQKQALEKWQQDYERWQQEEAKRDYASEERKRALSWAIAMLVTGIPVFAVHAPYVFKKAK